MVKTLECMALSDENTTIPIGEGDAEVEVGEVKVAEVNKTEPEVANVKEVWEPGLNVKPSGVGVHVPSFIRTF